MLIEYMVNTNMQVKRNTFLKNDQNKTCQLASNNFLVSNA